MEKVDIQKYWWWRLLKVIYIITYIPLVLGILLQGFTIKSNYEFYTEQNINLEDISKKYNIEKARNNGFSDSEIRNTIENKLNISLPYDLQPINVYDKVKDEIITTLIIVVVYVVVVQGIKKAVTYIMGK